MSENGCSPCIKCGLQEVDLCRATKCNSLLTWLKENKASKVFSKAEDHYNKLVNRFKKNYIRYKKASSKRKRDMYRNRTTHIASQISVLCYLLDKENPCQIIIIDLKEEAKT